MKIFLAHGYKHRGGSLPVFKGITIKFFQLFGNSLFGIRQREEGFVPTCCQDPCRGIRDTALSMALVLRTANTSRDDCGAIVVCEF